MSEVEQMMAGPQDDGLASGEHILVVDDDPFIARLLEIELQASGYDVAVASDGKQALDQVAERVPSLVLADVMMPNMDGLELTKRLREDPTTCSVSVILLTARGLSADKLEGFAVGADDYIVKPFDTPELLARIRGVLRRAKEMRAQSPLTGLPGNVRIEEEIESRVGHLGEHLRWDAPFATRIVAGATRRGLVVERDGSLELTTRGRELAQEAVAS